MRSDTVLLAVTGKSPAILTETIWALANPLADSEPVIPGRIVVVTTTDGKHKLEQTLFAPSQRFNGQTAWDTLRAALITAGHNLDGRLRFGNTGDDIRVLTTSDSAAGRTRELADIRTPADNEAAANFLLETVRAIVENPDTQLIASMAGGRKTMGALLYACLTLIGRETDRLTHVLVNEPFENLSEFLFPAQPGGPLTTRDGRSVNPLDATIDLADVPFVPLRNLFQRELGQPAGTFQRLVTLCRANVRLSAGERLRLEVERRRPSSLVNGRVLDLAPREHLVLLYFAKRAKHGETVLNSYDEAIVELNEFREQIRQEAPANDWSDWRHSDGLNRPFDVRDLIRVLSDIRAKAKRAGGDAAFLASVLPEKGRCSLEVPGPMIFLKS